MLHVGDVVLLNYGMKIPVDGLCIQADQLTMDESAMTGESDELRKEIYSTCQQRLDEKKAEKSIKEDAHAANELPSPIIMSGTSVAGGEGKMISIMVGDASCLGEILGKLVVRPETTPLQHKLEKIAADIGKLGTYTALLTIHVLLLRFIIEGFRKRSIDVFAYEVVGVDAEGEEERIYNALVYFKLFLEYVIIGVAIIVVAVPEGLPLAVMISLAYSIDRMLKDNNDVKRLASCEIMGGANNICSDKTGTLTLNQMKVTNIWAGKKTDVPQTMNNDGKMTSIKWADLFGSNNETPFQIEQNISCNTAEQTGATDRAMVELLERANTDMEGLRAKHLTEHKIRFPFSSKRKRMSTIVDNATGNGGYDKRIHIKGASEIVKNSCNKYLNE